MLLRIPDPDPGDYRGLDYLNPSFYLKFITA